MAQLKLPEPSFKGLFLEDAIQQRISVRKFVQKPLSLDQVSQLLWAGQGKTKEWRRAAPSAGATYPLFLYLVAGYVQNLDPGIYRYNHQDHALELVVSGDHRKALAAACLNQDFIADAPISISIAAEYERTTWRYGQRGIRYVHIEVGHVAQNILLEAVSLGLGSVAVGAFHDDQVSKVLKLEQKLKPLYILPVGYPAKL